MGKYTCRGRRRWILCLALLLAIMGTLLPFSPGGRGGKQGLAHAAEDLAVLKAYDKEVKYEQVGLGRSNWTDDFVLERGGRDYHGFCVNPARSTPELGSRFTVRELDDAQVRKILYYGYGSKTSVLGDLGLSSEEGLVISHVALARALGDPHWAIDLNARGRQLTDRFLNLLASKALPGREEQRAFLCHNTKRGGQDLVYSWQADKSEEEKKTSLLIRKRSAADHLTKGNASYSLAGACYGLYADSACKTCLQEVCPDRKESGDYEGCFQGLTVGKQYFIREIRPPANGSYAIDERVYPFTAGKEAGPGEISSLEMKEEPVYAAPDLLLRKKDAQLGSKGQGDGKLAGAEYAISYYPEDLPSAEASGGKKPLYRWIMRTDERGEIHFQNKDSYVSGDPLPEYQGKRVLPLGSCLIQEQKAPHDAKGRARYALDPKIYLVKIRIGADRKIRVENPLLEGHREQILRGGILIEKREASYPDGSDYTAGMSLEGIRFSIYNRSAETVAVDLDRDGTYSRREYFAPGAKIREITTRKYSRDEADRLYGIKSKAEEVYLATTDDDRDGSDQSLPSGRYGIVEETTGGSGLSGPVNRDYILRERQEKLVEIHGDLQEGQLCRTDMAGRKLTFAENNLPMRSDLVLSKVKEDTGERISVPFLLIREESGEKHILMTDSKGNFDSRASLRPHSQKTNANDRFLDLVEIGQEPEGNPGGKPQIRQKRDLKVSEMTEDAGLWFGRGSHGNMAGPNDRLGALPKGHYRLIELSCDRNRGYKPVDLRFTVDREGKKPEEIVNLGKIRNHPITPRKPPAPGEVRAPKMGDPGQIWVLLICGTFALGSMAVLLAIRKKK